MSENTPQTRIVVGVDGSQPSKRALQWARFAADATGGSIDAVAAWHIPAAVIVEAGPPADLDLEAITGKMLHDTVTEVLSDPAAAPVRELVEQGSPAQVLLRASHRAQLLIVGSRGHGGVAGLLLGSVSAACAEHARCPVLVIHGDTPPPAPTGSVTHGAV